MGIYLCLILLEYCFLCPKLFLINMVDQLVGFFGHFIKASNQIIELILVS